MRAVKIVLAAVLAAGAVGCNAGQPRTYRIAVDESPLAQLPPSCYRNNTVSTLREIGTNVREEHQWMVWDGVENKQYLDIGKFGVQMGHAEPVIVGRMIEGQDKSFMGQLVEQKLADPGSSYTYTKTLSLTINFEDMGASPKGSIDASSQYTCTSCTNNDNKVTCAARLSFVGRRIDSAQTTFYGPSGQ